MVDHFHAAIRKSLADANLQAALTANAQRRIQVRKKAFAAFDDPQALRAHAHRVRTDVIDHLDSYLEEFTLHAEQNGVIIHRAVDAKAALEIVLEIAQQSGTKLLAKSKTMVSEEIGLNHELGKQGLEVVETDLGEYIVQLRGEPPSHIITPAVHLRRQDVGKLFHEKLGTPYTDDISVMTNVARKTLREVFLNADIGISGVNFGVAETGTLCLVTNEGNGRMVTTIPKVHIALMGMERLVPTLEDLTLMLSLLPRSATGQKLSAYTSLINCPRRSGDPDGAEERHVVLIDNGRQATRASELREILYCIRCGACLNACPVFREIGGHAYVSREGKNSPYPGPMGSVVSPALFGQFEFGHLARASSLCGACREACPVDIDLPKLLIRVRTGMGVDRGDDALQSNAPSGLKGGLTVYSQAAASAGRFAFAQRLAGFIGSLAAAFSRDGAWLRLPKFTGWGYSKDFPRPAAKPFRARYHKAIKDLDESDNWTPPTTTKNSAGPSMPPVIQGDQDIASIFAVELQALGGHFISCRPDNVAEQVLEILSANKVSDLLIWEEAYLPQGLVSMLKHAGVHLISPTAETLAASSQVRTGLTGAYAGLADTGSIVLLGGPGRPLSASLLPEIHIALLAEKDIQPSLQQVLTGDELREAPASVVITGPSRTSDIEMTLTIGVHGPGELYVICIRE